MKIGVRQFGGQTFEQFCAWLRDNEFKAVDVGRATPETKRTADEHGLEIGTSDLRGLSQLMSPDESKRQAAVQTCCECIRSTAAAGVKILFGVFVPEDASRGRAANFELWKESFPAVAQCAEQHGMKIAMEGWPGPEPYYPALGCTPEMWRAMFAAVPSPAFCLNYDPSHLVRIGVDYLRALHEFADRVAHVHAKDTQLDSERLYEHGNLGPSFRRPRGFGEDWWRYTIPGDGVVDWGLVVQRLEDAGYDGIVSIELEDYRYWGSWEKQTQGLIMGRRHLEQFVR